VPVKQRQLEVDLSMSVPLSAHWEKLGLNQGNVPGDPQVLQGIVDDFAFLRDVAWSVSQGLDAVVASASSGGFEGAAAEALRQVVSGRLKAFIYNVARAFSLAGEAVAEYQLVLVAAQQQVAGVVSRAGGLKAGDPGLGGLKRQVQGQVEQVQAAAQAMERALRDAAEMVSQPIKVESLFERIWKGVEKALGITAMVLALASVVIDGPLGVAAFAAGAAAFGMTAVDYAEHRTNLKGLLLSSLWLLAPPLRGMFSLEVVGAGARALLGRAGQAAFKAGDALRSPAAFGVFASRAVVDAWRALSGAPGLLWSGGRAVLGAVWDGVRGLPGAVARDFASVPGRYPRLLAVFEALGFGRYGAYVVLNSARVSAALFTPMTLGDIAKLGFRGAWAEVSRLASWSEACRALGRGWAGYGELAGRAGLEMAALMMEWERFRPGGKPGLDAGPGPGSGKWADGAGKVGEPGLAPVTGGMPTESMFKVLRSKLPPEELKNLFFQAGGILRNAVRTVPVLGVDAQSKALWAWQRESLVRVAYALNVGGVPVAVEVARAIRAETGMLPTGLGGGGRGLQVPGETSGESSGTKLWLPESARSGVSSTPKVHGVPVGEGEHAALAPALAQVGEPSLLQLKLEHDASVDGLMSTNADLYTSIESAFTPEAQQAVRQLSQEGQPPNLVEHLQPVAADHEVLTGHEAVTTPGQSVREVEVSLPQDARIGTPAGQQVRIGFAPDGSVSGRSVVGGVLGLTSLFREVDVPEELAGRLGEHGFSMQDVATHRVVHFDGQGHPVLNDEHIDGTVLRHMASEQRPAEPFDLRQTLQLLNAADGTRPATGEVSSVAALAYVDRALDGRGNAAGLGGDQRVAAVRLPLEGLDRAPRLLDATGQPVTAWQADVVRGGGRVALRNFDVPSEMPVRMVVDAADGRLLEQTVSDGTAVTAGLSASSPRILVASDLDGTLIYSTSALQQLGTPGGDAPHITSLTTVGVTAGEEILRRMLAATASTPIEVTERRVQAHPMQAMLGKPVTVLLPDSVAATTRHVTWHSPLPQQLKSQPARLDLVGAAGTVAGRSSYAGGPSSRALHVTRASQYETRGLTWQDGRETVKFSLSNRVPLRRAPWRVLAQHGDGSDPGSVPLALPPRTTGSGMRYFEHWSPEARQTLFYLEPQEFTAVSPPDTLSVALGAILYSPATHPSLADDVVEQASRGVRSMVLYLKDAIDDPEVEAAAEDNLVRQFADLERRLAGGDPPLLFIRVRIPEQITDLVRRLGENVRLLCGFVLPKFTEETGVPFLEALTAAEESCGRRLFAMPVLESPSLLHLESRTETLRGIERTVDKYRDRVLAIRLGVTDFSSAYGLRRAPDMTAYDVQIVASMITDVVNVLGRADGTGFTITGPVWEHFPPAKPLPRRNLFFPQSVLLRQTLSQEGLLREIALDRANGLLGKACIHPLHIAPIQAFSVVSHEDYRDALDILGQDRSGEGVLRSAYGNEMNEVKAHRAWAERALRRAEVFGVARKGVSFRDLLAAACEFAAPPPLREEKLAELAVATDLHRGTATKVPAPVTAPVTAGLSASNPRILVASDLDGTLIYSSRALRLATPDQNAPRLLGVSVSQGQPVAYMTETAAGLLRRLSAAAEFVPTTTRTREQYLRINLPGTVPRFAICANGGHILIDGHTDRNWNAEMRRRVEDGAAPLAEIRDHLARTADPAWLRKQRVAEDLFVYLVGDRPLLSEGWVKDLTSWADERGWGITLQGRKVYAVPRPLTKSAAVAEIVRRTGAGRVLAAGDSLLDADLLLAADAGWRPGHGELTEVGWSAPHITGLTTTGVAAGEEILRRMLAETASTPMAAQHPWSGQWVTDRLGIALHGEGLTGLLGLALRRNPKRAHLLVSTVLGKYIPQRPHVVYEAGYGLGCRVRTLLGEAEAARAVVLGYAETATALGHSVADAIGRAPYLHSTRRPVAGVQPVGGFEEEHSHHTSHLLLPEDPRLFTGAGPLVLVDDEFSTGNTVLNTIRALHSTYPRDHYVIVALTDLRSPGDRARLEAFAAGLGARLDVVALATGTVTFPDGVLERGQALVIQYEGPAAQVHRVDLGWPDGLPDGGRHSFTPEHRERLEAALPRMARRLAAALPAGARRVLVLGSEELMYAPLRLAAELDQTVEAEVRFSATARSPMLAVDDPGYAVRTRIVFPSHDQPADGPGERYAYNVAGGGFDAIVAVIDSAGDTPALHAPDGLLAQLAPHTGRVLLATVPAYKPNRQILQHPHTAAALPEPLRGPAFSSYAPDEVVWLLKDLSNVELEVPVEEREKAVQSGAHYAESLPVEYQPSAEYQALFQAALDSSADRIARAVGAVTELVLAERGRDVVLVSLARAGVPVGILMRRWAQHAHGLNLPHYTVSIVRGRGLDANALRWLAAHHDPAKVVFVDGWTGKGAITRELTETLKEFPGFNPDLAVLADPGSCVRTYGTRDDFLIPSACLNSTVSGLVSRTVLREDLIGPGDFHGAKFYRDLAHADVSGLFLDTVSARFAAVGDQVTADVKALQSADRTPTWASWKAIEQISEKYEIGQVNLVKPGVGETTRILLRRVPWRILVRPGTGSELDHIRLLADQRGVPIEEVEDLPYSCVGLIHPHYPRGATGVDGKAVTATRAAAALAEPLRSPAFSSYAPDEVAWLVKDLSGVSGDAHYAESLPVEYQPSAEYQALFQAALDSSADRIARAVGAVTELVLAERGRDVVLVSSVRAGVPVGILMRRWAQHAHGLNLPHYAMFFVRGRGRANALRWLERHHDPAKVVFVDGWTGKGAFTREIADITLNEFPNFNPEIAVLADPGSCVRTYGTRDDFLIPSACLNSTVSGLVSRLVRREDLIGPGDFHGAKFYRDLAHADVSGLFLDTVSARFAAVGDQVTADVKALQSADRTPTWASWKAVEQISEKYGIGDVGRVKPGICETTRILLRRTWRILVRPGTGSELDHIRLLAEQRGVPIEEVEDLPFSCVGLVHPRYTRGATGADGKAVQDAEPGGFKPGVVQIDSLDESKLSTLTPQEAEAKAKELADTMRNTYGDPSADLGAEMEKYANDPYVAGALAKNVSPQEMATLIAATSSVFQHPLWKQTYEQIQDFKDRYERLLKALSATVATATRQTGADLKLPGDYADKWVKTITESSDPRSSGAAALMLRNGVYDKDFLTALGTGVLDYERRENHNGMWRSKESWDGRHVTGPDGKEYDDPMAGIMEAFGNNPDAGQAWLGEERLKYLIQERRWPTDDGNGLGNALEAATTVYRDRGPQGERSAALASLSFKLIGEKVGSGKSDGFWSFGKNNGWQVPAGMRDSVGRMLAGYMPDVYRVAAAGNDGEVPGVFKGRDDGMPPDYPYGASISQDQLAKMLQSIGADRDALGDVLGAALQMQTNVMDWTLGEALKRDPKAVEKFLAGQNVDLVDQNGDRSAAVMGFLLKNGIDGNTADENARKKLREQFVNLFMGAVGVIPVPSGKCARYVVNQAKIGLYVDMMKLGGTSAASWGKTQDEQAKAILERQAYNSLLNAGYLEGTAKPPESIIVKEGDKLRLKTPEELKRDSATAQYQNWYNNHAPKSWVNENILTRYQRQYPALFGK
jgi:citrate lyase beta subunit